VCVHGGGGGGEPCVAESGGGGSRHKEAEEVAGVEAAVEETGVERRRGDRQEFRVLG
jgi:hypothetical protein